MVALPFYIRVSIMGLFILPQLSRSTPYRQWLWAQWFQTPLRPQD